MGVTEPYFPYILFLEGSNFLTQNITIERPDGSTYTIAYDDGTLNRLPCRRYPMPALSIKKENKTMTD